MFDKEQVIKMLGKQVEKLGADYVYPDEQRQKGCIYFDWETAQPSCIVGHLLYDEFDMRFEDLEAANLNGETSVEELERQRILTDNDGEPLFTADAIMALSLAQANQDRGHPWGRAVELAAQD